MENCGLKLSLNEDQLLLKDSVARFVSDHCGVQLLCRLRDAGQSADDGVWRQMAELGWLALPFDEEDGGYGGSHVDVMVLMEELGRGLVVQPYLSTVLICGRLLARCDTAVRSRYLPALIAGDSQWALAHAEECGRFRLDRAQCNAEFSGEAYQLSGRKIAVLNGADADYLLVTATHGGGDVGLFLAGAGEGVQRRPVTLVDGGRGAELEFDRAPAQLLVSDAVDLLEALADEVILALGAQAMGSMEALLEMTVEYSKTRVQFGQPIGSFQALQHRMADMYLQCDAMRSLLYDAVLAHEEGRDDRARASSALKVKLGEAGRYISQQAVQLHGGIGMSDELAVGHHFKSLLLLNILFGDADYHLDRYVQLATASQVSVNRP